MDRTTLEQLLHEADARVALGERHIKRQRELIEELIQSGHTNKGRSQHLLELFEQLQVLHGEHRDRLRDRLAKTPPKKNA
jgi:septation ring formation regulator EzrA